MKWLAVAFVVGVIAYDVMPAGPWFRQVPAFALAGASYLAFERARKDLGW